MPEKALDLFDQMSCKADEAIYTIVFSACASLCTERAIQLGKRLLDQIPQTLLGDTLACSSAIFMLMKFGDVSHAERLFQLRKKESILTYASMMKGS